MSHPLAIGREQLLEGLRGAGLGAGEVVYVAASLAAFGLAQDPVGDVLWALQEAVGSSGTLVMPAFHFGFCQGQDFDLLQTPSSAGLLSESFRKLPGTFRSAAPPYHSLCARGPRAEELTSIRSVTSFGKHSIFDRLIEINARQLLIGCGFQDGVAHYHWAEEVCEVPYRFWKKFDGQVIRGGRTSLETFFMFARMAGAELDADPLGREMEAAGLVQSQSVGLCRLRSFLLPDFASFTRAQLEKDPLALLTDASRPIFKRTGSPVRGLDHVGIVSKYSHKIREFLADLELPLRFEGRVRGIDVNIQYYGADHTMVELVDPTSEKSAVAKFYAQNAAAPLHHLAFEVTELQEALRFFERKGYPALDGRVLEGPRPHEKVAFLSPYKTGGLLVELVEKGGFCDEP